MAREAAVQVAFLRWLSALHGDDVPDSLRVCFHSNTARGNVVLLYLLCQPRYQARLGEALPQVLLE